MPQVWPRQGGLEAAGPGHEAVVQARVGTHHAVGACALEGIAGAHTSAQIVAGHEAAQRVAQVLDVVFVDLAGTRQCGLGVVKAGGGGKRAVSAWSCTLGPGRCGSPRPRFVDPAALDLPGDGRQLAHQVARLLCSQTWATLG